MNSKHLFFTVLFLTIVFSSVAFAASSTPQNNASLEWKIIKQWKLPESPVDIVNSYDGKHVFILTKESKVLVYDDQGQLEGGVAVGKGVNAIDISPRAEKLYLIDGEKNTITTLSIDFIRDINISGSPFKGPEDAPVTVVLFTDFECPYCKKVGTLMDTILKDNPDTVKLVFKNMPLTRIHPFADPAARAALAAHEQGKFWEFHDKLFATAKLSEQEIEKIAVSLSLDIEKWKAAMDSAPIHEQIFKDMQDAGKAGVTGTPTIFVNGKLLKSRSIQAFQGIIDQEVSKKK